jgi:hypothetical protein
VLAKNGGFARDATSSSFSEGAVMKKNLLLTFGILWICCLFACPMVRSQNQDGQTLEEKAKQAKKNHQLQPIVDDPGEDCYDWTVDIRTLKDSTHRIYWKRDDCIRVHTKNNPFVFQYDMTFNENPIPEDDPLGAFAGNFGLKLSSSPTPAASAPTTPQPKLETTPPSGGAAVAQQTKTNDDLEAKLQSVEKSPSQFTILKDDKTAAFKSSTFSNEIRAAQSEFALEHFDAASTKLKGLQDTLDQAGRDTSIPAERKKAQDLQNQVGTLHADVVKTKTAVKAQGDLKGEVTKVAGKKQSILDKVKSKQDEYTKYASDTGKDGLISQLNTLVDDSADLDQVRNTATTIRNTALAKLQSLRGGQTDPGTDRSQDLDNEFVEFANLAAMLRKKLDTAKETDLSSDLDGAARQVIFAACSYKFFTDTDVSSIKTGLIDPLDAVLNDKLSFGYVFSSRKREGPWVDPESVTVTVTRTRTPLFGPEGSATALQKSATPPPTCSTDTTDLFEFGDTYGSFGDYFTDKPVTAKNLVAAGADPSKVKSLPNLVMKNGNKPQPSSTPKPQGSADPAQPTATSPKPGATPAVNTTVLAQDWLFGKARLVVSGGLSSAFLRKQEFQRSSSISGTTSSTVIGYKTNTLYRNTPMLYGHVLMGSSRHDSDAWYGTFGVTANSDSQGTDPEFLFGFSRSFAQQRFFLTGGAYVGERQKLDGGLMVGQVIPSTLTGDLPVTKSYHVGFGFGISYRLGSTKKPQDNTTSKPSPLSKPASPPSKPAGGSQ